MKHKKFQRWKKSHIATMVRMRKQGSTNIEIAKHFETSPESVALQFHKIKVETGSPGKRGKKIKLSKRQLKQLEVGYDKVRSDAAFEEMKRNAPTLSPEQVQLARKSAELLASKWKPVSYDEPAITTPTEDRVELFNLIKQLSAVVDKLVEYTKPVVAPSLDARLRNLTDGYLDVLDKVIKLENDLLISRLTKKPRLKRGPKSPDQGNQ